MPESEPESLIPKQELEKELERVLKEKDEAIANADYEEAMKLRDRAREIMELLG